VHKIKKGAKQIAPGDKEGDLMKLNLLSHSAILMLCAESPKKKKARSCARHFPGKNGESSYYAGTRTYFFCSCIENYTTFIARAPQFHNLKFFSLDNTLILVHFIFVYPEFL